MDGNDDCLAEGWPEGAEGRLEESVKLFMRVRLRGRTALVFMDCSKYGFERSRTCLYHFIWVSFRLSMNPLVMYMLWTVALISSRSSGLLFLIASICSTMPTWTELLASAGLDSEVGNAAGWSPRLLCERAVLEGSGRRRGGAMLIEPLLVRSWSVG